MRISLINPHYSKYRKKDRRFLNSFNHLMDIIRGVYPPLGLASIASSLEQKDHKVEIIDAEAEKLPLEQIEERLRIFAPDVVGLSATLLTFESARESARYIKKIYPDIPIIIGGPHLAGYPESTMELREFDFGVIGEGEITICELVDAIEKGSDMDNVDGIVYRDNGVIKMTHPRKLIENLDALPFPAWHLLPIDKYSYFFSKTRDYAAMIINRGCPFSCLFCDTQAILGNKIRTRSPEDVVDEMEMLHEIYGIREIFFYDDTFTLNKKYTIELCDEMISRDLDMIWECKTRVDCIDDILLNKMFDAGCFRIRYGIESGNDKILKVLRKGTTVEQSRNAAMLTKSKGIEVFAYFMFGSPEENEETLRDTINFAMEIEPEYVFFNITTPFPPGSALYEWAAENKYIEEDYWLRFMLGENLDPHPFILTECLDRKTLLKYHRIAYLRFYLRPIQILSHLRKIKDLNTLKKYLVYGSSTLRFH